MKIGIILDSIKVSWYINDLIDWIKKNPNLSLEVLLIQNVDSKTKSIFSFSLLKTIDRILFKIVNILEKRLIYKKYPQYKKHFLKYDLGKLNLKVVEVEFDHPELDWNVLVDNDLQYLVKRVKEAQIKGFDTLIGACPNLRVLKVKDRLEGYKIPVNEFNLMLEEL